MSVIRRRSQIVLGAVISTLLAGCNPLTPPCEPTDKVKVELGGKFFAIPTELRPSFLRDGAEVPNLPSRKFRDAAGRWAYCQRPDDPPAKVSRMAFPSAPLTARAREIGRPQLRSLYGFDVYVGSERRPHTPFSTMGGKREGFLINHRPGKAFDLFSPAGGLRTTSIYANCGDLAPSAECTVYATAASGLQLRLLLSTGPHAADAGGPSPSTPHPISTWPALLNDIDAFLGELAVDRTASNSGGQPGSRR
ncbi:hypothetical protein M9M90_12620 [Phenylobacterium sp. LH3H17]|uniref:hypothetical protein n=1 Tax=Phenylobacterium sp. LH3H17 TaxID=2903901 RepID=UPI0020C972E2|nr:hypothetical protein [Phenylobacterium sp. LH3H17]UTP38075.1 hypothetical protein M9M90_12620 [Phenylobacterium sp. LH3H17]